jgi:hypothetical protein
MATSKEIVLTDKDNFVLSKRAYNANVKDISAGTYYQHPFKAEWLKSKYLIFINRDDKSEKYLAALFSSFISVGIPLGIITEALFVPDLIQLISVFGSIVITAPISMKIVTKVSMNQVKRFKKVENIIKPQLSDWLLKRYRIEVNDEILTNLVAHIAYKSPEVHFTDVNQKQYMLRTSEEEGNYVVPYIDPEDEEKKIRVLDVNRLTELTTKETLAPKQQVIFNSITEKVAKLKNIRMTAEKSFIVERINGDLQEVLKLNDYGASLDSNKYDASKITNILLFLEKELDTIFDEEIKDIEQQLAIRMKMLNDRSPEDNSELRISR